MTKINEINTIGLVGLGLMGQGIAASLIVSGFKVIAYSRSASREQETINHIDKTISKMLKLGLVESSLSDEWKKHFKYVASLEELKGSQFVIETVGESIELKRKVFSTIEKVVDNDVVIATNTSGISLSLLQEKLTHKSRFVGMHWAEPAEISQFLEISPAKETTKIYVDVAKQIGERCGKEPSVLNFDVAGLISNRLMYAMMREAVHLVEMGVADIETVDKSFRNDVGSWSPLYGPFQWMDLTGMPIYAKVMETLLSDLSNAIEVPKLMQDTAENSGLFYTYKDNSEKERENIWKDFTYEITDLAKRHSKLIDIKS